MSNVCNLSTGRTNTTSDCWFNRQTRLIDFVWETVIFLVLNILNRLKHKNKLLYILGANCVNSWQVCVLWFLFFCPICCCFLSFAFSISVLWYYDQIFTPWVGVSLSHSIPRKNNKKRRLVWNICKICKRDDWWRRYTLNRLNIINIISSQEIIEVREWIPHIGLLTEVIPLKLFLNMVLSSFGMLPERCVDSEAGTSFYTFWSAFWFRFIPKMFSALLAAFLCSRAFVCFSARFGCSLFCRLPGFREFNWANFTELQQQRVQWLCKRAL